MRFARPLLALAAALVGFQAAAQEAPYLLFDNFPGSPSALNGKSPVIGNGANTYTVSGAQSTNAVSGNGNAMLNVTGGNAYAQYNVASAVGEIGFTFDYTTTTSTGSNPTAANLPALFSTSLTAIHAQLETTSGTFATTYFVNNVPSVAAWGDTSPGSPLSTGKLYMVRVFIEPPYAHTYLFGPDGLQLAYQAIYDAKLATAAGNGTWVFFQLFDGASNLSPYGLTYHSWWARAKQQKTASNTVYPGGIDQAPLGLRQPMPGNFTSLHFGAGTPSGAFSGSYDSSVLGGAAVPTIGDANPSGADTVFKLQSTGPSGGSQFQVGVANNTAKSAFGIKNDGTTYIADYNSIQWIFRPPYNPVAGEPSRYPTVPTCIRIGGTTGPAWCSGSGAPTNDAPIGSLYSQTDGGATTSLYVKTASGAGAGNWTPK